MVNYQLVILFRIISIRIYFLLGSRWFSGSLYSLLGGYRSSAQAISYEVVMIFIIFILVFYFIIYNFDFFVMYFSIYNMYLWLRWPLLII
jgi:NADH:ubiquinone oxidoreductase subunit H